MRVRAYHRWLRIKSRSQNTPLPGRLAARFLVLIVALVARFLNFFFNHFLRKSLSATSQILGVGILTWVLFQLIAVTDEAVENHARLHLVDKGFVQFPGTYRPGDLIHYHAPSQSFASTPVCALVPGANIHTRDMAGLSFRSYSVLAGEGAVFEGFFGWLQSALSTEFPVDRVTMVHLRSRPGGHPQLDPACVDHVVQLVKANDCVLVVDQVASITDSTNPAFSRDFLRLNPRCLISQDATGTPAPPPRAGPDLLTRVAIALSLIRFEDVE